MAMAFRKNKGTNLTSQKTPPPPPQFFFFVERYNLSNKCFCKHLIMLNSIHFDFATRSERFTNGRTSTT